MAPQSSSFGGAVVVVGGRGEKDFGLPVRTNG